MKGERHRWWLAGCGLGGVVLSACGAVGGGAPEPPQPVITEVKLTQEGGRLFASATLDENYIKTQMELLHKGEPLLGVYRFELREVRPWLPDPAVAKLTLSRHLGFYLITERFELRDDTAGTVIYSTDPEEAERFLGQPHIIPLGAWSELEPDTGYTISVSFTLEREGVSHIFRFLNRWLIFRETGNHTLQDGFHT